MSETANLKKIENAKLLVGGKEYLLPIVEGTEGERAIDIANLRAQTGLITLDSGYANTGATVSEITFIDGERGILRYRGIPVEELAEYSNFVETSYLIIFGKLPTKEELHQFWKKLTYHSMIHEDMKRFFDGYSPGAHPMGILSAMVVSLSTYYPDSLEPDADVDLHVTRLLSKLRTIAAFSYKKSIGQPFVYPRNDLGYCANFLNMMFSVPAEPYEVDPDMQAALDLLLILHADHEQNCSTSTARLVGSSNANVYASISAAICALWGPLHGGANQSVLEMLQNLYDNREDPKAFMEKVKDKKHSERLMGFGHRVYKNHDPRAKIIKRAADKVLAKLGTKDPLFDIAKQLEDIALADSYFQERKLYPNVDFYSGLIYKAMGIPTKMFTVMFVLGRIPGWIAQWKEMMEEPGRRIGRPRQIYTGRSLNRYVTIAERG